MTALDGRSCAGGASSLRKAENTYSNTWERDVVALRRIVDLLQRVDRDHPLLGEVAAELDILSDDLQRPGGTVIEGIRDDSGRHDPVSGVENAIAPPILFDTAPDGTVTGEVVFGLPYEGPVGFVHGGVSAMVLHHALGTSVESRTDPITFTHMTVRYHRGVPLFEAVVVRAREAERIEHVSRVTGELVVAGKVVVSAEGQFIPT